MASGVLLASEIHMPEAVDPEHSKSLASKRTAGDPQHPPAGAEFYSSFRKRAVARQGRCGPL